LSQAVHRRGQVAALRKAWRLQGEGEQGMAAVRGICRGRHSRASRTPQDYVVQPQRRMPEAQLLALKRPLGSGALASTVRRVVTLRLTGPRIFGCRARAEAILLVRSYYKAGRWNLVKHMATSHRALLEA